MYLFLYSHILFGAETFQSMTQIISLLSIFKLNIHTLKISLIY